MSERPTLEEVQARHDLMPGAHAVRKQIEAYFSEVVPPLVKIMQLQKGYTVAQLPVPKRYDAVDPLSTKVFPTVGSNIMSNTLRRVDITDNAEQVYHVRYRTRVFCWMRTPQKGLSGFESPGYETAIRARDDMGAILLSALLSMPSLGTAWNPPDGYHCEVQEQSIQTEYFDATRLGGETDRFSAGVSLNFDLDVQESLWHMVSAVADTIHVTTDLLPPTETEPTDDD